MPDKFRLSLKQRLILKQLQKDGENLLANRLVFKNNKCYAFSEWRCVAFKVKKHADGHYTYDPKTGTLTAVKPVSRMDDFIRMVSTEQPYKKVRTGIEGIPMHINRLSTLKEGWEAGIKPYFITDMQEAGADKGDLYVSGNVNKEFAIFQEDDGTIWFVMFFLMAMEKRFESVRHAV